MLIFIIVLPTSLQLFLLAKSDLNFLFIKRRKKPLALHIFTCKMSKSHYSFLPSCYMLSVYSKEQLQHIRFLGESELEHWDRT